MDDKSIPKTKEHRFKNEDGDNVLELYFKVDKNDVKIQFTEKEIVECKFFVNDNMKITPNKHNLKILNAVQNIIERYIKENETKVFIFVSSDSSKGRSSLYKRFAMYLASKFDYKMLSEYIENSIFCIYKSDEDLEKLKIYL